MKASAKSKTPATQNPSPTQHKGPRLTSILLSCLLLSSAPAFASVAPFEPVTINPGSALRQAPGVIVTTDMSELARFRQTFGDAKLDQVDYSDLQKLNQLQDLVRGCEAELAEVHHNYEHYRQAQEPGLLNSIWKTLNLAKSDYDKKQRYETVTRLIEQLAGSSSASEILTDHYGQDSFVRTFSQETGLTSPQVQLLKQSRQAADQAIEEPGFLSQTNLFFHWLSDQLPIGPQGVSARLNRGYGKNTYKPQAESNPFFDAKPNAKVEPLHLGYGDSWHKQKSKQAKLKKLMAKLVHKHHHPNHKPHHRHPWTKGPHRLGHHPYSNWHTPNKPWQHWNHWHNHHHHNHTNHTNSTGPVPGGAAGGGLGISEDILKEVITADIIKNGIRLYNVGQGNGMIVQSFSLNNNNKYNWIIDAGSKVNPSSFGPSVKEMKSSEFYKFRNNFVEISLTDIQMPSMGNYFCPNDLNTGGIIFMSHLDNDHISLIPDILERCLSSIPGQWENFLKNPMSSKNLLAKYIYNDKKYKGIDPAAQSLLSLIDCLEKYGMKDNICHLNLTNLRRRGNLAIPKDIETAIDTCMGMTVSNYDFLSKNKLDESCNATLENFTKWSFANSRFVWIAPYLYVSPQEAEDKGLESPYTAKYRKLAPYLQDDNRIKIEDFIRVQDIIATSIPRQFYLMNDPRYDINQKNENSLMLILGNKNIGTNRLISDSSSVIVLADAELDPFLDTFYFQAIKKNSFTRLEAKSIVAAHHGAQTKGSDSLLRFFKPSKVYFSAGISTGDSSHPTQEAIKVAYDMTESIIVPKHYIHYYDKKNQEWVIKETDYPIYVTAGAGRPGNSGYYYNDLRD